MGRFPASGARLHGPRQPKPANAAFRQGRPPRSHGSSLGLEHPQSAIRPACREGPTLDVIEPPPVPPAQRRPDPPRRPRGTLHASPGDISSSPAIRRGCRPSRAFANPALRTASRAYRQTSRARRPCIGGRSGKPRQKPTASQGPAEAFARTEDSRRQIAASMPHASGPTDRRPRPRLSKRPRKRPWGGQLRRRKCTERNAAPEAPQERRRGCTRTPRRRRRSGWTRP